MMAKRHAKPGQQLFGVEWLANEIVCAEIKSSYLLIDRVARGHHQDDGVAVNPKQGNKRQSVAVWQTKIEQDGAGVLDCSLMQRLPAVFGLDNGVTGPDECVAQETANGGLIVHHKNFSRHFK